MLKAAVEPVGLREKMTLELRGDVLVCHARSWAQSYTLYVPSECMTLERSRRRDGRILIAGLLAPLMALLLMGLSYIVLLSLGAASGTPAYYTISALLFIFMFSGIYTIYAFVRFLRPIPIVRLHLLSEDGQALLEFWNPPGKDHAREQLIDRMFEIEQRTEDTTPFPLKVGYTWQHVRPWRQVVSTGVGGTLGLYFMTLIVRRGWEYFGQERIEIAWPYFLIFLLPWIFALGRYGLALLSIRNEPDSFRAGIRHYDRGEFEEAEREFLHTLDRLPRHVPSLFMLIQICAYKFDFDAAFRFSNQLAALAPEEAELLQEELWTLKRLNARMIVAEEKETEAQDGAANG